eukprot:TRINITY_DN83173_c0_g1_i1.p1 TRINITY_DN83173_c0_g1~~TRINITY_DN83173_c0_g1_i1.p1  ORF type:complete len:139 (+),score=40.34 TRINITY_DN83173_c0_g1_i1:66-482(+)
MEDVQRFTKSVEDLQTRVQKLMLPCEKKMARCALNCYDNMDDYTAVHKCVESCQRDMQGVAKRVSGEFDSLQNSVQACQQSVVQRLNPRMELARTDPEAQKSLQKEFEEGAKRCVKDAEPLIPDMEGRIKAILTQAAR